jgi:hypothetical protein
MINAFTNAKRLVNDIISLIGMKDSRTGETLKIEAEISSYIIKVIMMLGNPSPFQNWRLFLRCYRR